MQSSPLLLGLCFILWSSYGYSQKIVERTIPYIKGQKIDLDLKHGTRIQVTGWDKQQVYLKAEIEINDGKLNDAFLLNVISDKNNSKVRVVLDEQLIDQGEKHDCPSNETFSLEDDHPDNNYICYTINYQIYVPREATLNVETIHAIIVLIDLTGQVSTKSISSQVERLTLQDLKQIK
jgi:hypothetical protein